ncbi:MAG: NAD(P)/FAD-dependent oxidoreductase, partial [bacterium (Candidatus Ratteibacteria) CG01_land_8_20_14_3_00_40_19]
GKELKYDKLLLATGSSPKLLGVEGEDKDGVFGFRTLNDAKEISKLIPRTKKVLIFGGGLIGLKAGYALKQRGIDVEIIEKSPRILSQVTDNDSAEMVGRWLMENGIKIRTGLAPKKVLGNKKVEGVLLDNEEKEDCQGIIIGIGVRPNIDLIKDSKIQTHWGVITNQYLQTNVENIYAGGDVAETTDLITGEPTINALWTAATEHGRIAGLNMAGERKKYPGSIAANSIDFFGLPIISLGYVRVKENGYEEFVRRQPRMYQYKKIVLKDKKLVGAVLVGNIENAGVYLALIRRKVDISGIKDILLEDWFDYSKVSELLEQKEGFRETVSLQGDLVKMA